MKEIVFAGFGGQGVLTSGLVISDIAAAKKLKVTWMPSYGSAMRGGTANCTVKYGEGTIFNPSLEEPDVLLAMNNPSYLMFINKVKPGGIVVINSELVTCNLGNRKDITIYKIPCNSIAAKLEHAKGANIVMTGVIVKAMGDFTEEEAIKAMNHMFAKKGKSKFEEINTKAFKAGYEAI